MRKCLGFVGTLSVLCVFGALPALGHNCDRQDNGRRAYDNCTDHHRQGTHHSFARSPSWSGTENIITLEGQLTEFIYLPGATPEGAMVEVHLKSGGQLYLVRLAPAGYLKNSDLRLKEGASITLKGYAVAGFDGSLIVATEVAQGGTILHLRDSRGRSMW